MGRWFEEGIEGGFAVRFETGRLVSVMEGVVQRDLAARWSRRGDAWAAPAASGGDLFTVEPDPRGVRFCERDTCYTLRPAEDPASLDAIVESDDGSETGDLCVRAEMCCFEGKQMLGGACDPSVEFGPDPTPSVCTAVIRGIRSLLEERGLGIPPNCDL